MIRRQVAKLSKNISVETKKRTVRAGNSDLGPALFVLSPRAVNSTLNTSLCKWWCSPFLIGFEKHLYCRLNKCLSVYFSPSIRQKCAQAQPSGRHGGCIIATEQATKPYTILTVVWVHNNLQQILFLFVCYVLRAGNQTFLQLHQMRVHRQLLLFVKPTEHALLWCVTFLSKRTICSCSSFFFLLWEISLSLSPKHPWHRCLPWCGQPIIASNLLAMVGIHSGQIILWTPPCLHIVAICSQLCLPPILH